MKAFSLFAKWYIIIIYIIESKVVNVGRLVIISVIYRTLVHEKDLHLFRIGNTVDFYRNSLN